MPEISRKSFWPRYNIHTHAPNQLLLPVCCVSGGVGCDLVSLCAHMPECVCEIAGGRRSLLKAQAANAWNQHSVLRAWACASVAKGQSGDFLSPSRHTSHVTAHTVSLFFFNTNTLQSV